MPGFEGTTASVLVSKILNAFPAVGRMAALTVQFKRNGTETRSHDAHHKPTCERALPQRPITAHIMAGVTLRPISSFPFTESYKIQS